MDPNRKRRAGKLGSTLGTARPDPTLAKLTDEELQRAYDAAVRDAEAAAATEAIADPRTRELVRALRGMSDDELLAAYHETQAALAAEEAERERRRPTPREPESHLEMRPEPPEEIHAVMVPEPAPPEPPPPTPPGGHTGFPVDACECWLCAAHRLAARREAEARALAQRDDGEPMIEGSVGVAPNATAEFVAALGGIHGLQR